MMAFLSLTPPPSYSLRQNTLNLKLCKRKTTLQCCASQPATSSPSTSDTFGIDAGRDLFFTGMDESIAISLLEQPLGTLKDPCDRFIAVERLKFYNSIKSTRALIDFVRLFDSDRIPAKLPVEEYAAKRKAVESLGRLGGAHLTDEVRQFLESRLNDTDFNTVENAVWALSQLPGKLSESCIVQLFTLLSVPNKPYRAILQTLTAARAVAAVDAIRLFQPNDEAAMSAAATALAVLDEDYDALNVVPPLLRARDVNVRRAAIIDLTTARYPPTLPAVARSPISLVLRLRAARGLIATNQIDEKIAVILDRLVWDHPHDIDLLGIVRDTPRARSVSRNVRALYRNDALDAYVACRTLAEDAVPTAGQLVLESYTERAYFDYFGAYHAFKTLGWLRFAPAFDTLLKAAAELPPRFFNHRMGAISALANLGDERAIQVIMDAATEKNQLWQVKYACLVATERLGDGRLREKLLDDDDWLIRARARLLVDFAYLSSEF